MVLLSGCASLSTEAKRIPVDMVTCSRSTASAFHRHSPRVVPQPLPAGSHINWHTVGRDLLEAQLQGSSSTSAARVPGLCQRACLSSYMFQASAREHAFRATCSGPLLGSMPFELHVAGLCQGARLLSYMFQATAREHAFQATCRRPLPGSTPFELHVPGLCQRACLSDCSPRQPVAALSDGPCGTGMSEELHSFKRSLGVTRAGLHSQECHYQFSS